MLWTHSEQTNMRSTRNIVTNTLSTSIVIMKQGVLEGSSMIIYVLKMKWRNSDSYNFKWRMVMHSSMRIFRLWSVEKTLPTANVKKIGKRFAAADMLNLTSCMTAALCSGLKQTEEPNRY